MASDEVDFLVLLSELGLSHDVNEVLEGLAVLELGLGWVLDQVIGELVFAFSFVFAYF